MNHAETLANILGVSAALAALAILLSPLYDKFRGKE